MTFMYNEMHIYKGGVYYMNNLNIPVSESGFYEGFCKATVLFSKFLVAIIVIWAVVAPEQAGAILSSMKTWSFQNLNTYYIYAVAFYIIVCLTIAIVPKYGKIKLGDRDGVPEFSNFSWFSMMFGAGIGIGMLGYAAAEPIWHLANNPDIIMSKEAIRAAFSSNSIALASDADVFAAYDAQVAVGALQPIADLAYPKTESALDGVYRYTFLHWGLGAWACYALVGIALSYYAYAKGLPLTIRSSLAPLLGKRLEGTIGHIIDISAVIATILGISQTIGLGLSSLASGLHNITGIDALMTAGENPEPSTWALLFCLFIVMILSTLSALSGVGKGIKWLSNINMVLSFTLLAFFFLFGSTFFVLQMLGLGIFNYLANLPAMTFVVWDPSSDLGGWQTGWSVFYWAWWIAFAPFVGIFLARISRNRTIREFVIGATIAPAFMCFVWFAFVGGTAIDLELSGAAEGTIFSASLTYQLYAVINVMLSSGLAQLMSVMIVILLLTYLVTSADSAVLVINTINAGGSETPPANNKHIIIWGLILTAVIGALILAGGGGLGSIQSAMIVGAIPFSFIMILMGICLIMALNKHEDEPAATDEPAVAEPQA